MDLTYALRKRLIVERGKTNPLTHEGQAILEEEGVFGFLRIPQAAITVIELARVLLFRNQQSRRLGKEFLQVVVFDRRLLVEFDDVAFFVTVIWVPETSFMMCSSFGPGVVLGMWSWRQFCGRHHDAIFRSGVCAWMGGLIRR